MPAKYYRDKLYPFQDQVLKLIQELDVGFYLTGGTALGRCFLNHRYSDDLDLFVNADERFRAQCNLVLGKLTESKIAFEVGVASESFVRLMLKERNTILKLDFVNDVAFRWGTVSQTSIFKRVDNWRNILSNKLCAMSRLEAKDIVDILFIAFEYEFNWEDIFEEAGQKDIWVNPLEISKIMESFPTARLREIKWTKQVKQAELGSEIEQLRNDLFYGNSNSLYGTRDFGRHNHDP